MTTWLEAIDWYRKERAKAESRKEHRDERYRREVIDFYKSILHEEDLEKAIEQ